MKLANSSASMPARALNTLRAGGVRLLLNRAATYTKIYLQQKQLIKQAIPLTGQSLGQADLPVLLVLDHSHGGGAHAYRGQRVQAWLQGPGLVILWQYMAKAGSYLLTVYKPQQAAESYATNNIAHIFAFLEKTNFSQVLCNSLVGWPQLEPVLDYLSQSGKAEFALHDFFPICPSYNLLNTHGRFCGLPTSAQQCCMANLEAWRAMWGPALHSADILRASHPSVADFFSQIYPGLKITVTPLPPLAPQWSQLRLTAPAAPLHIGVIGNITHSKGAGLVKDLARLLAAQMPQARLTVIGQLEARGKGIRVTGPYQHQQLPALLQRHGVNVCLIPSICPETFCYAAQEIMQLAMPLVCLDLGAQGAKARAYDKGMVASTPDALGCLEAILKIYCAP